TSTCRLNSSTLTILKPRFEALSVASAPTRIVSLQFRASARIAGEYFMLRRSQPDLRQLGAGVNFHPIPHLRRSQAPSYFSSMISSGKPAARHASRPPRNALAALIPTFLSNRAARALLPSFGQVQ